MIRDIAKLRMVAGYYDIPIEGRAPEEIANELADLYISQFGQQRGEVAPARRAPEKRQELWRERGVMPRGVDREVVEALHRTHIGDDQDPEHILEHAIRTALADGWGGSNDRHRHFRHPVRHPRPRAGTGQPGRDQRRHGQHRSPRP